MELKDISVEIRDKALNRLGKIDPDLLVLKAVRRHRAVGEWSIDLPYEHPLVKKLWVPGSGVIIQVRNRVFLSGPTNKFKFEASTDDPQGLITFSGVDDTVLLADALAWPTPSQWHVESQTDYNNMQTGAAESVMKAFVDVNIGPSAPMARRGLLAQALQIEASLNRGINLTKLTRFENLLDLLTGLGLSSGLGYRIVQVGTHLEFQVYEPQDRSAFVQLDVRNNTLEDQSIEVSLPAVTRAIVGGNGEGVTRQLQQRTSPASQHAELEWGRHIEEFLDERSTSDPTELAQAGDARLVEAGFTTVAVKAVPADDNTREYLVDWDIGDTVGVVINGLPETAPVTEVAIVANSSGVAAGASIGDVSGFQGSSALHMMANNTSRRLSALERSS
jgi:hypothetical protein